MATEKILQTRILNKIDTLENWDKSTLGLKKGELAFVVVEPTADNGLQEAVVMVKIGEDGVKTFKDLPWNFYAKASDVIAAAKSEDTLRTFINGVLSDNGVASNTVMEALAKRVTDAEGEITTLKGDANTAGSVAKAIADAIAALDLANTYDAKGAAAQALVDAKAYVDGKDAAMDERVDVLEAAIAADGVVDTKIQNAINALDVTDTAVAGKYVSAVNEVDGKVVITRADLPDYTETYAAKVHGHEIADVNGLADAIAEAKKAGTDANAALETYKGTNDAAVKKVADDLASEILVARAAEKANADAITAMKDHASVDSFSDVMAEIAKKQDTIPANTYDAYGAAAQALTDANAYTDGKDTAMDTRVKALEDKFGDGEGNVEAQIAAAVAAEKERAEGVEADLQEAIDTINDAETGILAQAKAHADGKDEAIAAAQKAGDDAMAEAQKKVASVTAADASVAVGGTATAPTVAAKLSADADNALTLAEDGLKVVIPAAAEYSIVKAADSGDYAAVYNLTKDGTIVGASINIPKDMVVKSGSVVGDEIVLVLNDEAATEIKIPVASLIEYVTSGSATGDMVVVNVSDDHKVTATITDGTITLAKLTTEVQTAIGKAHVHENADVINAITADDVANWNGAQAAAEATAAGALATAKSELEGKITAAQTAAEKVANDNNAAMNTRVEALEAIDHDHANKAELDLIASGDKAKWDAKVDAVTAAADSGLKATRTGNDIAIEIDDSIVFVFDCGDAGVTA